MKHRMKIVLYGDGVTTYLDFDNPNPWGDDLRGGGVSAQPPAGPSRGPVEERVTAGCDRAPCDLDQDHQEQQGAVQSGEARTGGLPDGQISSNTACVSRQTVLEHARIPLGRPSGVIVIPQDRGSLVMVWNRKRVGWEFPGGHIEEGEGLFDAARRECLEEGGIRIEHVTPWCSYLVVRHRPGPGLSPESRGVIAKAQVTGFERFTPTQEIGMVGRFRKVPDKVTFRDGFIEEVFRLLNEGS